MRVKSTEVSIIATGAGLEYSLESFLHTVKLNPFCLETKGWGGMHEVHTHIQMHTHQS